MSTSYAVTVEPFAERHFIKRFSKKYKNAWDVTWRALEAELQRIDSLFQTTIAAVIAGNDGVRIVKVEFRIAGTQESRKASGNRLIAAVDAAHSVVRVLLVYSKNDLPKGHETVAWKEMVKANYPEYAGLL